eukprot:46045-Rhodomonas_salina.4
MEGALQMLAAMQIHSIPTFIIGGSMVASGKRLYTQQLVSDSEYWHATCLRTCYGVSGTDVAYALPGALHSAVVSRCPL